MDNFDLVDRQIEVDTQNHDLVALYTHHNRKYDKTGEYDKHKEKDKGRDKQPLVEFFTAIKRNQMKSLYLLFGYCS